jgi:hypothetical protein
MVRRRSPRGGRRYYGGDDDLQRRSTVRPDGPDSKQAPTVIGAARRMGLGGWCAWTGLLSCSGGSGGAPRAGRPGHHRAKGPHHTAVELRHLAGLPVLALREAVSQRYVRGLLSGPLLAGCSGRRSSRGLRHVRRRGSRRPQAVQLALRGRLRSNDHVVDAELKEPSMPDFMTQLEPESFDARLATHRQNADNRRRHGMPGWTPPTATSRTRTP